MEFIIKSFHFTECTNYKCKAIFPIKLKDVAQEEHEFCPKCKSAILDSHVVQCENCQTIINIISKLPNENDIIFYVDKCSTCSGTIKEENLLHRHFFPESFA